MNINFEEAASMLAENPSDFTAWSLIIDAFNNKISSSRTINGNLLSADITLLLASDDFANQGTTTTVLHGNAAGNPSWGAIVGNDITNSTITYDKIQNITVTNRFLGRITTGAGIIEELTGTQATTLLDLFSTSTTTKGLVPGSNGVDTTYFLRADGTWAVPTYTLATLAHNSTTGIQGGTTGQYYHLTAPQMTNTTAVITSTAESAPTGLNSPSDGITIALDGTQTAYVVLNWNAIVTSTFDHYVIEYKKTADTYYVPLTSNTTSITIEGLVPNTSYTFRIAAKNRYGTLSAYSSTLVLTTDSDSTAPNTVSNVTATGGIQYVIVEWDKNTEADLASYNVYRHTVNNSAAATLIGNSFTDYFIDGGRTGGTALYYWIKAVDTSGNESASFSTVATATPRDVGDSDISATAAIAASKILIDGTVYLSNWRHASDITKIDGGTIYTSSITADKISVSSLAAINADLGSVTAGRMVITTGSDKIWLNDSGDGALNIGGSVKASAPFKVSATGSITATAGSIAGWSLGATYLYYDGAADANSSGLATADYPFYAGKKYTDRATAPFRVTPAGVLTATNATITGSITGTSGTIGGWNIDDTYIWSGTKYTGSTFTASAGDVTLNKNGGIYTKNFYVHTDGSTNLVGTSLPHLTPKLLSANTRNSNNAEEIQSNTGGWVELKTIQLTNGIRGTFNISYEHKRTDSGAGGGATCKVYVNGVSWGTEKNPTIGVYNTWNETYTGNLGVNATISVYVNAINADDFIYIRNFVLQYDDDPTVASTNV